VFARNRDSNERAIVDALVAAGASVTRLNETGVPDLLVGFRGETFLLEVKREGARGGRRHYGGLDERGLARTQQLWWDRWSGRAPQIVTKPSEALAAIGADLTPSQK
jgi:hypothetical protein